MAILVVVILMGPAPFAFCFVSLLDGEAHLAGGTAFRPLRFVCVVLCF